MASTYTTNIGIEKPATGDQSGTWGDTTNTNFDIIDQGTNGVAVITLASAGTSGSPNSLPISNGALSDGRNRFIEFNDGGDLGATAYVQLDPNDAEKIVHIRNSLSASRSLILFQGTYNASNDFEVPNGADVLVKFDGGGTGATVTDVNVNLTPTKLTTNTISSTDTNGNLTIDPNGTGDIVLDANVGIGTVPSAWNTFTASLQIDGASLSGLGANNTALASNAYYDSAWKYYGTGSASLYQQNSGLHRWDIAGSGTAGNTITFTEAMRIDSSGNVGIGTSTASNLLTLGASGGPTMRLIDTTSGVFGLIQSGSNGDFTISADHGNAGASTDILFKSDGATERMRIDSSGNVGIGGAPSQRLLVANTSSTAVNIQLQNNTASDLYIGADTTNLVFYNGGSERMRIDSSGSVGIGTSSPQEQIHSYAGGSNALRVSGGANNNKKVEIGYDNTNGPYIKAGSSGVTGLQFYVDNTSLAATINSNGNVSLNGLSNGTLAFSGGNTANGSKIQAFNNAGNGNGYLAIEGFDTEYMRIDSSGNVGIQTSSPAYQLQVGEGQGQMSLGNATSGNGASRLKFLGSTSQKNWQISTNDNVAGALEFTQTTVGGGTTFAASPAMLLTNAGFLKCIGVYNQSAADSANVVVDVSGNIYRSTSALKYKQDIRDIEEIDISQFRPIRYKSNLNRDDQTKDHFGFIADEAHDAGYTELVSYGAVNEETGIAEVEGFRYDRMTVLLTKVVQQQQETITALEARIAALEAN